MALPGVTIQGVLSSDAGRWWPVVSEWCEAALAHGGDLLTLDDVKEAVAKQEMQLWVISDGEPIAVCVTTIHCWPRTKVLTAIIVAGENMAAWVGELDALLCAFARSKGCSMLNAHGRRGWSKQLGALGWADALVTFEKRLDHGKE